MIPSPAKSRLPGPPSARAATTLPGPNTISRPVPRASAARRRGRLASTGSPVLGEVAGYRVCAGDRRAVPRSRSGPFRHAAEHDVAWSVVLVLLPPSETKSPGGSGDPLDLGALSSPELTPVRAQLLDALTSLAADP